jgi:leucyl aminopeptidase (aminopeptidase T)
MMLYTTLNEIRKHSPCESGWQKLLISLGKTKSDNKQLSFKTILESNGLDDSLWCLRAVKGYDKEIRFYAVWCARQVEHLDKSGVSKQTNDVSEKFANGDATCDELYAARAAARAAASAAARAAAWDAAWVAARAAASAAARAAAWDAAWVAAWAAQEEEFIKRFCRFEINVSESDYQECLAGDQSVVLCGGGNTK